MKLKIDPPPPLSTEDYIDKIFSHYEPFLQDHWKELSKSLVN